VLLEIQNAWRGFAVYLYNFSPQLRREVLKMEGV